MISLSAREFGFTLVEAMVAIVVLSMGLFAAYGWISVNINTLSRTENVFRHQKAVSEAIESVRINLADTSNGEVQTSDFVVVWQAEKLEGKSGVNRREIQGLYDHRLYSIRFDVFSLDSNLIASHVTRMQVSEMAREPQLDL